MTFLLQLDCASITDARLPDTGLLSFFYEDRHPLGAVHHTVGNVEVSPMLPPSYEQRRWFGLSTKLVTPTTLRPHALTFESATSIETDPSRMGLDERDGLRDPFGDLVHDLACSRELQIGGFPISAQGHDYPAWAARKTGLAAVEWELLLQVEECGRAGLTWGDAGTAYYLIPKPDLEQHKFDRVWFDWECG